MSHSHAHIPPITHPMAPSWANLNPQNTTDHAPAGPAGFTQQRRRWRRPHKILRKQQAWTPCNYNLVEGIWYIETSSLLPVTWREAGRLTSFELARAAAEKSNASGIGLLTWAASELECVCLENAFDPIHGVWTRKEDLRVLANFAEYLEVAPNRCDIFAWNYQPPRRLSLALNQLELVRSVAFAPYTGWEVMREDADRLEPWSLGGVDEHDAPAFGPQSAPAHCETVSTSSWGV